MSDVSGALPASFGGPRIVSNSGLTWGANTLPCSAEPVSPEAGCLYLKSPGTPGTGSCPCQSVSVGLGREQAVQALRFPKSNTENPAQSKRQRWGNFTQTPTQITLALPSETKTLHSS